MTQTTYQVTLTSDDGTFAVTVATTDPKFVKKALAVARQTYKEIVGEPESTPEQEVEEEIPVCAVHNVPMIKQSGKYGSFWSCHQRNEDGNFCSYRAPHHRDA